MVVVEMKKNILMFVLVVFMILSFSGGVSAANLIYSEDFDDQAWDIPPIGNIFQGGAQQDPWEYGSPGRGGFGYCYRAAGLSFATLRYGALDWWTASGINSEYYFNQGSRVPNEPAELKYGSDFPPGTTMNKGTVGSLGNNEWGWSGGQIYVRLANQSDPDSKPVNYIVATYTEDAEGDGDVNQGYPFHTWGVYSNWYTDEIYYGFWMKYEDFATTDNGGENNKYIYSFFNGGTYVVLHMNGPNNHGRSINGATPHRDDAPGSFTNSVDGNWHHYEMWIKFSTDQFRFWYDGNLIWNEDLPDIFNGYIDRFSLTGSIESEERGNGRRVFDDLEIWDGMPTFTPECNDTIDNDFDRAIDFSGGDTGCDDANDDDESNCGDLVCEGGETCLTCVSDCGICPSACSPADSNTDGSISITEIMNYITQWKSGSVTITALMTGIGEWKNGC